MLPTLWLPVLSTFGFLTQQILDCKVKSIQTLCLKVILRYFEGLEYRSFSFCIIFLFTCQETQVSRSSLSTLRVKFKRLLAMLNKPEPELRTETAQGFPSQIQLFSNWDKSIVYIYKAIPTAFSLKATITTINQPMCEGKRQKTKKKPAHITVMSTFLPQKWDKWAIIQFVTILSSELCSSYFWGC